MWISRPRVYVDFPQLPLNIATLFIVICVHYATYTLKNLLLPNYVQHELCCFCYFQRAASFVYTTNKACILLWTSCLKLRHVDDGLIPLPKTQHEQMNSELYRNQQSPWPCKSTNTVNKAFKFKRTSNTEIPAETCDSYTIKLKHSQHNSRSAYTVAKTYNFVANNSQCHMRSLLHT